MNNYCLYYIHKSNDAIKDVLMVYFGVSAQPTRKKSFGDIDVLMNEKPIAYVLNNFSKLCKVKINGTIFLPNNALIDLINSELKNANLETLSYKDESGFVVGKILKIEENKNGNIITVNVGKTSYTTISTYNLKLNDLIVYAKNNCYLFPGHMIQKYEFDGINFDGRICSYKDLQMNNDNLDIPVVLDEGNVGDDFFQMEVKCDA